MVASTCSWVVWLSMMKASVSSLRLMSTEGERRCWDSVRRALPSSFRMALLISWLNHEYVLSLY